jgi:hypothetical protein
MRALPSTRTLAVTLSAVDLERPLPDLAVAMSGATVRSGRCGSRELL